MHRATDEWSFSCSRKRSRRTKTARSTFESAVVPHRPGVIRIAVQKPAKVGAENGAENAVRHSRSAVRLPRSRYRGQTRVSRETNPSTRGLHLE